MLLTLIFGAAFQVATSAAPSPAVDRINGWSINDNRGSCSAATTYDGGVFVYISYTYGTDSVGFIVANPAWESIREGANYSLTIRFNNGSTYNNARAIGVRADDSGGRLTGIAMRMNGDDFLSDFAGARSVAITMGEVRVETLGLRGTRDMIERLVRCSIASHRRFPPDPFASVPPPASGVPAPPGVSGPTRARANLNSYFSVDDYPAAALRGNEQGTTGFRLNIGPNGRVTECSVTSSSGSTALDEATCRIIMSRARYTPARDSAGNPTGSSDSGRVTWRLPPPPPPQPSRIWLQMAFGTSRAGLAMTFADLRRLAPTQFHNLSAYTAQWNAAQRLLAGPFENERAARDLADQLRTRGIPAQIWRSEDGQQIEPLATP